MRLRKRNVMPRFLAIVVLLVTSICLASQDRLSARETSGPQGLGTDTRAIDLEIAQYDKAIALDPNDSHAYAGRGDLFIEKGDYDRGMADYQKAIDLGYDVVYYVRAEKNIERGYYDLAIDDYTKLIDRSPKDPNGYRLRSNVYLRTGNNKQAIEDLSKVIELSPKQLQGYHDRGLTYLETGNYERALADFSAVLDIDPTWGEEYVNRGVAKFLMGQYTAAVSDFDQVLRMSPNQSSITTGDATLMYYLSRTKAGQVDETFARRAAKFDRTKWPGPVLALLLGRAALADVRAAAAKGNATEKRDQRCTAAFWIGENELMHGRPQTARSSFRDAVKECPQLFFEHSLAAFELKRLGN